MAQPQKFPLPGSGAATPTQVPPPIGKSPVAPAPDLSQQQRCVVDVRPDGSGEILLRVDSVIMKRIQSRAQTQDLGQYLWDNVLRRALESHVF